MAGKNATPGKLPEALASPHLAAIVVALIDDAAELLEKQYAERQVDRVMAPMVQAFRGLGQQIAAYHPDEPSS